MAAATTEEGLAFPMATSDTGVIVKTDSDGLLSVVSVVESICVEPSNAVTLLVYRPAGKGAIAWKVKTETPPAVITKGVAQWRACPTMIGSANGKESNVALPGMNVAFAGMPGKRSTISSRAISVALNAKLVKVIE